MTDQLTQQQREALRLIEWMEFNAEQQKDWVARDSARYVRTYILNSNPNAQHDRLAVEGGGMKYRKKPVIIEATQWFKNGDHPEDYAQSKNGFVNGLIRAFGSSERAAKGWEGSVVRYYRNPDDHSDRACSSCRRIMHDHGWIDTAEGGHIVCPGDYIITGVQGERYPCKPDIFEATYEPVENP